MIWILISHSSYRLLFSLSILILLFLVVYILVETYSQKKTFVFKFTIHKGNLDSFCLHCVVKFFRVRFLVRISVSNFMQCYKDFFLFYFLEKSKSYYYCCITKLNVEQKESGQVCYNQVLWFDAFVWLIATLRRVFRCSVKLVFQTIESNLLTGYYTTLVSKVNNSAKRKGG